MSTTLQPTTAQDDVMSPTPGDDDTQTERAERRRQAVLLAQADASRKGLPKREIMQRVCMRAMDGIGARLVAVARPHGSELVFDIAAGAAPDEPVRVYMESSLTGHCFRNRESMLIADVQQDSRSSLVASHKFSGRSLILVPVLKSGKALGVLMATTEVPNAFDADDLHILEVMAGIITSGVSAAAVSAERQLLVAERAAAREQLEFQAKLLQSVEQSVIAVDMEGRLTYWNKYAEKLYGWTAEEAIGRPALELFISAEMEVRAGEIMQELRAGRSWSGEFRLRRRDGTSFLATVSDTPILDASGALIGFVCVSTDRTEQRELETQLRQAHKMEAVGQLAGGVAHDFNNILTAIIGYGEMALSAVPAGGPVHEDLVEILQAAQRAADLTKQLLTFSRKQVLRVETVDMTQVVRGIEKMLRRMINESVMLETVLPDRPVYIDADRSQLEQLVLNLAVNARDAMPDGGRLTVAVGIRENEEGVPRVQLQVSDNGCGMTDEVKRRIFEPFFTTKAEGRGTGLGLAVVFGIVRQLDGTIKVDSALGHGTCFTLTADEQGDSGKQWCARGRDSARHGDDSSRRGQRAAGRAHQPLAVGSRLPRHPDHERRRGGRAP